MNAPLPKYMSIKDFCAYTGFSRYQFLRLAQKANIPIRAITPDIRSRFVDVQEAIRIIESLSDADREVPVNLPEVDREVPVELAEAS
jgi:hypothetical protein